jgi:hypothetical protein
MKSPEVDGADRASGGILPTGFSFTQGVWERSGELALRLGVGAARMPDI